MEHLPKDEARRIAANIARLAELLGLLRRRGGRAIEPRVCYPATRLADRREHHQTTEPIPVPIKRPFIYKQKIFYGWRRPLVFVFVFGFMGCTPIQRHIAGWDPTVRNRSAGAAIAAQGAARPGGYRYYHNGCYRQRPDGAWLIVAPEYCAPPPEPIADDYDGGDDGYRRGPHYGGGQCRELRQACLHKEELGEQGMGNCQRYRELCR
jgi:hypothetical protein